jgi:5-methylcytosine-specific restriction endonuclease McrA
VTGWNSVSRAETTAIPAHLRKQVDERDGGYCRFCGKYLAERRAIHHIQYGGDAQGMGGRRRHALDNLISVCWMPGDNGCHQTIHANKRRWTDIALQTAVQPGVTMLQLAKWAQATGM